MMGTRTNDSDPQNPAKEPNQRLRRRLIGLLAVIVILTSGAVIVWELQPQKPPRPMSYYTVDDGKTWFTDDAEKLPPFDHRGKPAVRAFIFECRGTKMRFTGWLQKLPEDALKEATATGRFVDDDEIAGKAGWLAKRPGDAQWVSSLKEPERYREVVEKITCPSRTCEPMPVPASGE